jgi:gamma-glutamyltranspeptidase / glutathione hydrolase
MSTHDDAPLVASGPVDDGMVATSHPLAAAAGVAMLERGGSAADAAVAASAVLCVVDPRSTGIGGDAFAQCWEPGAAAPVALAAAGPAPAGMSVESLRAAGFESMPERGPWSVTVPGSVEGWRALLARFGRLDLGEILAPAIALAEEGFAVSPVVAGEWAKDTRRLEADDAARETFLPGARAPAAGERFANPDLAGVLRSIAEHGPRSFYEGAPAELIGAAVEAAGGPLRASDLAGWDGAAWVAPISRRFRDVDVYELPPPGQGVLLLEALGIFERVTCDAEEHAAIEALKLAFADALAHVADPQHANVPTEVLLDDAYLSSRAHAVDPERARPAAAGSPTDTVYLAVVAPDGAACSFIHSLYEGFGSGVGVAGAGICLQNRGAAFVLDEAHPNRPEPGKRPYHTIIPSMLGRGGGFFGCLGVVGGYMQPQGQMQILRHLLDHGMDLGAAMAAPRARYLSGLRIGVEPGFDPGVVADLARRGHEVSELPPFSAGGGQAILRVGDELTGASDHRKDGRVLTRSDQRSRA